MPSSSLTNSSKKASRRGIEPSNQTNYRHLYFLQTQPTCSMSRYWIESSDLSAAPTSILMLQTSPLASLFTAKISVIDHQLRSESSFNRTASPTLQFLCCLFHFPRFSRVSCTSFLSRFQNSLDRCWNLLQCFRQYQSGEVKWSGGGITNFDFLIRMSTGLRLVTSLAHLLLMDINLWLPQLQQAEFARTHQVNYFHESLVRSLKLLLHSLSGIPQILPCCLTVVDFFSISSIVFLFICFCCRDSVYAINSATFIFSSISLSFDDLDDFFSLDALELLDSC